MVPLRRCLDAIPNTRLIPTKITAFVGFDDDEDELSSAKTFTEYGPSSSTDAILSALLPVPAANIEKRINNTKAGHTRYFLANSQRTVLKELRKRSPLSLCLHNLTQTILLFLIHPFLLHRPPPLPMTPDPPFKLSTIETPRPSLAFAHGSNIAEVFDGRLCLAAGDARKLTVVMQDIILFQFVYQLEKAKKKEVAFIVTFAKREQEIIEPKVRTQAGHFCVLCCE
ncbi:hypothetical protein RHGRI_026489 [Rhododendron griersonianum]|uniref:Uncharacterized protein n=1 Tax=Rhododendron griersonianum TaxID=479676 RepID=A0AAV6IVB2_9ERIC|nr:hypothetical protein RHGRI_026489 [Rhododendron griersonianum]